MKENRQTFGLLLEKGVDLNESLEYPITTYPLSFSVPDVNLSQGQKICFRITWFQMPKPRERRNKTTAAWRRVGGNTKLEAEQNLQRILE